MSADPIIYCLERLTDYPQFERLCSDLMAGSGYPNIEPLGGATDGGRDALHVCRDSGRVTLFAYTVRADWKRKLQQDCKRIQEERHNPTHLVFVCTSTLTTTEKDESKKAVHDKFGWVLDIYEIERIRVALAGPLRHLVAQHPAIFCPPWFPVRGGLSIADSPDTVVIDHVAHDHALAAWLSRKLSIAGFRAWCYGLAPLAGEDADASIRALIDSRAAQYLPIFSTDALSDANLIARCGLASSRTDFVLPCWAAKIGTEALSTNLRKIQPARFHEGWSTGIRDVLGTMESRGIAPALEKDRSRAMALRDYVPEPLTKPSPERVFANVFAVTVPTSILVCDLVRDVDPATLASWRRSWAYVQVSPTKLLGFTEPPPDVPRGPGQLPEYAWDAFNRREGKKSTDVVKELIRRTFDVACVRAGLVWCDHRRVYYFPHPTNNVHRSASFKHVDGRGTHVALTGEKQYGWGERATRFRYQLGPMASTGHDEAGSWWITMRIYVRVTDTEGVPFELKDIVRRRKAVTKGWWNKEWLARLLGVMQALENEPRAITVGVGKREVRFSTEPLEWICPVAIDVEALDRVGDFQEELAAVRERSDDAEPPSEHGDEATTDE
jgi:hypothetical protein